MKTHCIKDYFRYTTLNTLTQVKANVIIFLRLCPEDIYTYVK